MFKETYLYLYLRFLRFSFFPSRTQQLDRHYDPSRIAFYSQFIKAGDLCFDVGANAGNRTAIFLKLKAQVVAVEPQPGCYKMLKIRFGSRIKLVSEALGAKQSVGTMYLSANNELSSLSKDWINSVATTRFKFARWDRKIEVSITTLDKLIKKYGLPVFCKVDVEGFEEQVFAGLSQPIPILSYEYTIPERMENALKSLDRLSELGSFECNLTIGEEMVFRLPKWVSMHELKTKLETMRHESVFGDIYVRYNGK